MLKSIHWEMLKSIHFNGILFSRVKNYELIYTVKMRNFKDPFQTRKEMIH